MLASDMRSTSSYVMSADSLSGLAMSIDLGVVVVPGSGYGPCADGVRSARGRVRRGGVCTCGAMGRVFVTEAEDHDEVLCDEGCVWFGRVEARSDVMWISFRQVVRSGQLAIPSLAPSIYTRPRPC